MERYRVDASFMLNGEMKTFVHVYNADEKQAKALFNGFMKKLSEKAKVENIKAKFTRLK